MPGVLNRGFRCARYRNAEEILVNGFFRVDTMTRRHMPGARERAPAKPPVGQEAGENITFAPAFEIDHEVVRRLPGMCPQRVLQRVEPPVQAAPRDREHAMDPPVQSQDGSAGSRSRSEIDQYLLAAG
jgi:hypothetical protein